MRDTGPALEREDAEQRIGGSQGGHPTDRGITPFITCERVHSIKMNCFIEKTGNNISEDAQSYSEGYYKMLWMREARIRTFMQLELEACQEEIVWMIRYHNCEALNRPQEEYPARPLPIPPIYIDNLHSRLIKVQQGVWPPTLKKITKTRYNLPAPTTSPRTVQPDDVSGWGEQPTGTTTSLGEKKTGGCKRHSDHEQRGEILYPKPRSRPSANYQNSPIAKNW